MVHPCNCSLLRLLAVICIVLHGTGKKSVGGSNSCEVTKSTIQIVDNCPDSEEKWMIAAARKNCSAYANQCSEPNKLVYHCVINEYVTETLEVCAYSRYIFSGKCTGYSISGNVIQQNSRTNCSAFTNNSCPSYYNSDEAYKYPDCYKLTKKTTVAGNPTFMTGHDTFSSDFTTTKFNVSFNTPVNTFGKEDHTESNNSTQTIIIVMCVVPVLIAVVAVFVYLKIIKRKSQNKNKQEEETHHLNGTGKSVPN